MTVVYILLIVVIFLLLLILIRQNLYTRSRQNPQLDLQVKQLLEMCIRDSFNSLLYLVRGMSYGTTSIFKG